MELRLQEHTTVDNISTTRPGVTTALPLRVPREKVTGLYDTASGIMEAVDELAPGPVRSELSDALRIQAQALAGLASGMTR